MIELSKTGNFLFYNGSEGKVKVQVVLGKETVWATQKSMSEIFRVGVPAVNKHLSNIFESGELDESSVISKMEITANDGKLYNTKLYNLDAIISVGYRVSSYEATQFRIWASSVLKEYLIKGFALDDDRLKQGKAVFGKDYFDELLERIKEIRTSERRFYQKITDIYAQCSLDYDSKSPITKEFYATVQNKLHYAITHQTAAEIISKRANAKNKNMGLTTWKNAPEGKILKTDVNVAKNYLTSDEISQLNDIVNFYLDFAELQAKRQKALKMSDWVIKLDDFLKFNEYDLLTDAGKVSAKFAKSKAEKEYKEYRVVQDKEYISDFDKITKEIKQTGKLPKSDTDKISQIISKKKATKETPDLSEFNQKLDKALKHNPKKDEDS
ncbi:MAG: virulence RhuM family protein [Cyclobacteriaceae bacterium]